MADMLIILITDEPCKCYIAVWVAQCDNDSISDWTPNSCLNRSA